MNKILIIDDSRFARNSIGRILQQEGLEIIQAEDGKKGLVAIAEHLPDCVVADLLMPEMDGFEMLAALMDMQSRPPVIIVTADIQDSTRDKCMACGAFRVLEKPVKASLLKQTVRGALEEAMKGVAHESDV